jgi:uncharacterized OB-fold protein
MPPFSDDVPYIAALVDLEEGPRLTTRLVDVEPADVHIGMKLMARCTTTADGDGIVLFTSADGS